MTYTPEEIKKHLETVGCFCDGSGTYTDYNCGASFEVTCPHCAGTGKKRCQCETPSLKCGGR